MTYEKDDRVATRYVVNETLVPGTRGTVEHSLPLSPTDWVVVVWWDDGSRRAVQASALRKLDLVERIGELA